MKGTAFVLLARLLSVGILCLASVATGAEPQKPAPRASEAAPAVAPAPPATTATPGMRAYLDPESGTIGGMPPAPLAPEEETAVLELQDEEQPVETVLPDGSVMVDLKGHGQEYFILQIDASGRRVVRCVHAASVGKDIAATPQPVDR
jgi:hypothetical protein